MSNDVPVYNLSAIRRLLTAAFTARSLRRFCQDRPVFRPIVNEFAPDHGLNAMVDEVIDFCGTHLLFDDLLAEIEALNPRQYARYEGQLVDEPLESDRDQEEDGFMPELNPFIYPGPVGLGSFSNREEEILSLLSRIATGQNTALVGEPNIGKSSLLQHLLECEDCHERLGRGAARTVFVFQDCHLLPQAYTPADFWQQVLVHVREACNDEPVREVLDWADTRGEFGNYALERVFRVVGRHQWRVALLVDEFDSLLHHPNFNTAEFFGALRSLATRFSSLAVVTASRMSITEMNRQSEDLNPFGSPFFNGFIEINLHPFSDRAIDALLDGALEGTGLAFDRRDRDFVRAMAGGHPFLLQAAAGALYDAHLAEQDGRELFLAAGSTFYKQMASHMADLWRGLDTRTRVTLSILCLGELLSRVSGQPVDAGSFGSLDGYFDELGRLAERGSVELWQQGGSLVHWGNWTEWRGERCGGWLNACNPSTRRNGKRGWGKAWSRRRISLSCVTWRLGSPWGRRTVRQRS